MITQTAPAKVNLYLHIGPVRRDGLHQLESLFFFTDCGDQISVTLADRFSLDIEGEFAAPLLADNTDENLVLRAARELQHASNTPNAARITLQKNLPVAAGIGGGSADAAATLRALMALWEVDMAPTALHKLAFSLGADIPACLSHQPQHVRGAGDIIASAPPMHRMWVCLINPRVETPTGPIFQAFDADNPSPMPPTSPELDALTTAEGIRAILGQSRNDLQKYAITNQPIIGEVIDFLTLWPNAIGARLSGSGATCFALFEHKQDAEGARRAASANGWWAVAMGTGSA